MLGSTGINESMVTKSFKVVFIYFRLLLTKKRCFFWGEGLIIAFRIILIQCSGKGQKYPKNYSVLRIIGVESKSMGGFKLAE